MLAPFVTRPNEVILDRAKYNLPPAAATVEGVYRFRQADPNKTPYHGTIVLQGSAVTSDFVTYVLPRLDESDFNMNIYYASSAELFAMLPEERQQAILPDERKHEAMGITGFTMPTIYRWVTSDFGRRHSLFSFSRGIYPGSGKAEMVMREVGLDGPAQWQAIQRYIKERR